MNQLLFSGGKVFEHVKTLRQQQKLFFSQELAQKISEIISWAFEWAINYLDSTFFHACLPHTHTLGILKEPNLQILQHFIERNLKHHKTFKVLFSQSLNGGLTFKIMIRFVKWERERRKFPERWIGLWMFNCGW